MGQTQQSQVEVERVESDSAWKRLLFSRYPFLRGFSNRLLLLVIGQFLVILLLAAAGYISWEESSRQPLLFWLMTGAFIGLNVAFLLLLGEVSHRLVKPLDRVLTWSELIKRGNLSARIEPVEGEKLSDLECNINELGSTLQNLSQNMESEVQRQTERLSQKTNSLQVLYDVAASINASRDLKDLLTRFLYTMRDIVNARAGTVRLLTEGRQMELVASIGLDDEVVEQERMVPVQRCLCGSAVTEGEILFQQDLKPCNQLVGMPLVKDQNLEMIAVPLQYRGKNLGVYNLFVEKNAFEGRDEVMALFTSIGRHLGMAIEKAHLDNEAKRLSIMQERNALSHELHDSLAQTLAGLRFQVTMLSQTLDSETPESLESELAQIKGGLDDAYTELRELLAHFRAPMSARGLLPALEDLISSFRTQTGIHIFLQKEWESTRLAANMEMQVLRIVQEALANIRKHSQAHTVRVMLRCDNDDNYMVLIEDDGVGMDKPAFSGHPGEHLGLSIMQERARYLGGDLKIESESGEGTRVQLTFRYPGKTDNKEQQHFALI